MTKESHQVGIIRVILQTDQTDRVQRIDWSDLRDTILGSDITDQGFDSVVMKRGGEMRERPAGPAFESRTIDVQSSHSPRLRSPT